MGDREADLDRLIVRGLALRCIIGVNPGEREHLQDVRIDLDLYADLSTASRTDSLGDSVDYRAIKRQVVERVESSSFLLIERLAGEVAEICLLHPAVRKVRVRVEKPGALRSARSVGVELVRRRPAPGAAAGAGGRTA